MQHLGQCGSESLKSVFNWKIIDQASSSIKLLTLKALHIRKERLPIITRDEFRSRELFWPKQNYWNTFHVHKISDKMKL